MMRLGGKRTVDLFTAAVIVSVAVALAGLTWRLAGDPGTATVPVAAAPQATQAPATDVAPLLALAPFGRPDASAAPATSLPLVLHGIVLADTAGVSSALIAVSGAKPASFAVGQDVGGGRIEAIGIDRVLLTVAGRRESLSFPSRAQAAATISATTPPPPAPPPAGPQALPPSRVIASGPPSLSEALGARQTAAGLEIGDAPSAAARRAGLQSGDVIEKIDGSAPGDAARDQAILTAAAQAGRVRIDIRRGTRRFNLTVPL